MGTPAGDESSVMRNEEVLARFLQNDAIKQQQARCAQKTWCAGCVQEDGCGWCEGTQASRGTCQPEEDDCYQSLIKDDSSCPNVGADVVLRNVSGLLGAMLAVALLLNVLNRCQNKRRSQKLKRSIFTLPVYVYPSREKKMQARREARARLQVVPSDAMHDAEDGQSESSDDAGSVVTCTICLAAYENEEVIKVLPCGHDFHSGCLDSWLELKAMCPLCKKPAFSKWREPNRSGHHGQSQVHALSPPTGWTNNPPRGRSWLGLSIASIARPRSSGPVEASEQEGGGVDIRGGTSPRGTLELTANVASSATESAENLQAEAEAGLMAGPLARGDAEAKHVVTSGGLSVVGTAVAVAEVGGLGAGGEQRYEEPTPCCRLPRREGSLGKSGEVLLGELETGRTGVVAVPGGDGVGFVASDGPGRVARREVEAKPTTDAAEMDAPTSARMVSLGT